MDLPNPGAYIDLDLIWNSTPNPQLFLLIPNFILPILKKQGGFGWLVMGVMIHFASDADGAKKNIVKIIIIHEAVLHEIF